MTVFKLQSMVALTLLYIGQAFKKIYVLQVKYPCKLMKIGKECQKMGNIYCFGGTNFLLYLYLTANICPVYLMQP